VGGSCAEVRAALLNRLEQGELRHFVDSSTDEQLRAALVTPLTFVCGAGSWYEIERGNRRALIDLADELESTTDMAARAYDSVFGHIISTILLSTTRTLDRRDLIVLLRQVTAIPVPSKVVSELFGNKSLLRSDAPLEIAKLREISKRLLEAGKPSSITALWPQAAARALAVLGELESQVRSVTRDSAKGEPTKRLAIADLLSEPGHAHLILGPPGAGKTHALWAAAKTLYERGSVVPIFLSTGHMETWDQAVSLIARLAPDGSVSSILSDNRICVCLDGWSELPGAEKRKAINNWLGNTRLIANGKFADVGDAVFTSWSLESLAPADVMHTLGEACPAVPLPNSSMLDLLRLPLLLSLHALGAGGSLLGELLRQFHDQLLQGVPEAFTEALAGAIAAMTLSDDRSYGHLLSELRSRARQLRGKRPVMAALTAWLVS
jgi:hypothetical protein